ncbi:hypothetical protein ACJU26_09185 [Acidithiobacillus sp. M4-SHS-6]|uniref:hypothetical protein n=1 Tax=Acidithiobacillus sp. M4-SHS-6 TaxID=3383024 RepID=UPI0039BE1D3A
MSVKSTVVSAVLGGLMGAAASVAYLHFVVPANEVYTLNVARVVNAERVILSRGEARGPASFSSAETELFRVNHTLRRITERYARNHLVVVKQAIVGGPSVDITDQVLRKLGLPVDAARVSMRKLLAQAPTDGYAPLENYMNQQKLMAAQKGRQQIERLNRQKTLNALP